MAFIRKIKKKSGTYLAEVESYRENGKVKQRFLRYIGKEITGATLEKDELNNIEIERVQEYLDYKVLHEIAIKLKIPELLGEDAQTILLLVYAQMITRKSINALPVYVEQTTLKELLGIEKLVSAKMYESLDKLETLDFEPIEKEILSALTAGKGKEEEESDALILDVTDTYFKGKQADWKSRKGKDGKVQKLIQIALAVTKTKGFPILHKTYEGNISNIKIFEDLLSSIRLHDYSLIVLDRV
jgi:transposase